MKRAEIRITGMVQGIGFRPFIYNLARKHSVRGWVLNNEKGVFVDAESDDGNLDQFIQEIPKLAPPLARIETFDVSYLNPLGYTLFEIKKSEETEDKFVLISPDLATCDQCLSELFSPQDFRYRYSFINCTLCGPRFTIIKDIPYDRHKTTMASFTMCPICQKEYDDPANRRFHAQPNACPSCGPSLWLQDREGKEVSGDSLAKTLEFIEAGFIIAIKGLGGFHLACNAKNEEAVSNLRSRKFREDKPFAVMCRDMEEVRNLCEVNREEEKLLADVERPIVILKRKRDSSIAHSVAPHQDTLGVMLPYSPLHHILLNGSLKTLVMTSGNVSDEPIAYRDEEAKNRLGKIADYFLLHNREIHMRCDDSVTRVFEGNPYIIRRSRGYVPFPIKLSFPLEMILACGGELKNTFCLTRGPYAFLSHHIGDLENLETLTSFEEGIEHFKRLFYIEPKAVAYDLHPDYLSAKYALSIPDLPTVGVQHHHAHIVSCMVENRIEGEVIGVAMDGTGFGTDGTIWGGEFLKANLREFVRLAHLKKVPMPGGSMAIKQPWRMAMVCLSEAFGDGLEELKIDLLKRMDSKKWDILKRAIEKKINTPWTSSMGRLFDAISSLLSIRDEVNYEGQAAIELEMIADREIKETYPFYLLKEESPFVIDSTEVIRGVVGDLTEGVSNSKISGKFHRTIARMIVETCEFMRSSESLNRVVLSGGVFQNILLLSLVVEGLKHSSFDVYTHHLVPTNDGGISLGQAVIAHMRLFQM
ncbi:MAG: carbamoyltransferase HypF [Deltaproteobacteria bacterium]|nr:carbamoyltransferase HypF [Deltaproteobacteria bacterium]